MADAEGKADLARAGGPRRRVVSPTSYFGVTAVLWVSGCAAAVGALLPPSPFLTGYFFGHPAPWLRFSEVAFRLPEPGYSSDFAIAGLSTVVMAADTLPQLVQAVTLLTVTSMVAVLILRTGRRQSLGASLRLLVRVCLAAVVVQTVVGLVGARVRQAWLLQGGIDPEEAILPSAPLAWIAFLLVLAVVAWFAARFETVRRAASDLATFSDHPR